MFHGAGGRDSRRALPGVRAQPGPVALALLDYKVAAMRQVFPVGQGETLPHFQWKLRFKQLVCERAREMGQRFHGGGVGGWGVGAAFVQSLPVPKGAVAGAALCPQCDCQT